MKLGMRLRHSWMVLGACVALSGYVAACGDDDDNVENPAGTGGSTTAGKGGSGGKAGSATAGKGGTGGKAGATAGKGGTGGKAGATAGKGGTGGKGGAGGEEAEDAGVDAG